MTAAGETLLINVLLLHGWASLCCQTIRSLALSMEVQKTEIQKEKEEIDAYERKWGPVMPRAVRERVTRRAHVTRSKLLSLLKIHSEYWS